MSAFPQTIAETIVCVERLLSENPDVAKKGLIAEAEQIVQAALKKSGQEAGRTQLLLMRQEPVSRGVAEEAIAYAKERAGGRLLQHVIGYQRFLNHDYLVGPDVLVPRPETEVLVAEILKRPKISSAFEIGLGSGAISIELLSAIPGLTVVASELSERAIARARSNAARILGDEARRLKIFSAKNPLEVFEPIEGAKVDLIVSNPPYLGDEAEMDSDVLRHEPREALFAPVGDPGYFYRMIAQGARRHLTPGGLIAVEIPHERAVEIKTLFQEESWETKGINDLTGRPRVILAEEAKSHG